LRKSTVIKEDKMRWTGEKTKKAEIRGSNIVGG
jgi:hypothetical protein